VRLSGDNQTVVVVFGAGYQGQATEIDGLRERSVETVIGRGGHRVATALLSASIAGLAVPLNTYSHRGR